MKGEEIYIMGDQPTTCPLCGVRTEIVQELFNPSGLEQTHLCPSNYCRYTFTVVES